MYVATSLDRDWLRSAQSKLYARSKNEPDYVWRKLWGLVTDRRNLRLALVRVSQNKGARTAGVDGRTVRAVLQQGPETFIEQLRAELRSGRFRPSPARRVLIPKAGQPGKFRPLGIPTVRDRVVQAAMKNILEPIFEADFYPVSYGFRPGKSVHSLFRPHTLGTSLAERMRVLNPRLRGWCNFYHAWGAKHVFSAVDHYVWWTIYRWLRKKHLRVSMKRLAVQYGWRYPGKRSLKWRDGDVVPFECAHVTVERFKLGGDATPCLRVRVDGKPGA
jgi:hypothetical protein